MRVLVTGAGALLGQGIIASLRNSRLAAEVVAVDPSPLSAGLFWTERAHLVTMADDPQYRASVERVLRLEKPRVVLVGTDVELVFFARHQAALEAEFDTKIVVSSPEAVAIADDKWRTAEFLRQAGLDHAASALPGGEEALIERVGFPLVVKPRVGARSVGMSLVRNRDELARAVASVKGAVIQENLGSPDDEYTAGVIVFDGRAEASIVMRRDLRDGNTYRAYVGQYPELNAEMRKVAEALRPHGPVNFQFRLRGKRPVIFEINCRFSGTTPLRALAGFNEVEMVIRRVVLGEPVRQPAVEDLVILRHWSETGVRPERIAELQGPDRG